MNRLTVKQYAEKNNISVQTVYTKMKRKKEILKNRLPKLPFPIYRE